MTDRSSGGGEEIVDQGGDGYARWTWEVSLGEELAYTHLAPS